MTSDPRPLIAHVLFRFSIGGLENGVVNLINHMPAGKWRHAVIALDDIDPAFARRVQRSDVLLHALKKPPGHLLGQYPRLIGVLRRMQPAVVHTRNLAALEATIPAWLAGVGARVHGEHGWDVQDIDGRNSRYQRVRKLYKPFVRHYIALSDQIAGYLRTRVGVDAGLITRIYNGVDTTRFTPRGAAARPVALPFQGDDLLVVGTVGRMQAVKDQLSLLRAFAALVKGDSEAKRRMRLVIVGDGPVRPEAEALIRAEGLEGLVWLPGARDDVPELMRALDLFVLPSLSEGISNTILEAMATGLPVIATRVGGNAELVDDGVSGAVVPPADPAAIAAAVAQYLRQPALIATHGAAGRRRAEERFSIGAMVAAYSGVYERVLRTAGKPVAVTQE